MEQPSGGVPAEGGRAPAEDGGQAGAPEVGSSGGEGGEGGPGEESGLIQTAVDCGSRDVTGATVVTGPLTQSTTWSGVVHLPQGLSIRNEPTLTIMPGTKVIVGSGATLEVGADGSQARIVARGTVAEPIKFCGETAAAGSWQGIVVRSGVHQESVLRNVLVADAGASDAALSLEMPLTLQGVQVRNSKEHGVSAVGYGSDSSTLIVAGAGRSGVVATAPPGVEVPPDSQLTGNTIDAIDIALSSFDMDVTFRNHGVPYRQLSDVQAPAVLESPLVSFEPGVDYRVAFQRVLDLGDATLEVLGTAEEPVVLQSLPCTEDPLSCPSIPEVGEFARGGRVISRGGEGHTLEYLEVRNLSGSLAAQFNEYNASTYFGSLTVVSTAPTTIDHLKVAAAFGYGLKIDGPISEGSQGIEAATPPVAGSAALFLGCDAIRTLPEDTVVTSSRSLVNCKYTDTDQAWSNEAGPYVLGNYYVYASLTLEPGTTLYFRDDSTLTVHDGATLSALGTTAGPITFDRDGLSWIGIDVREGSSVALDHAVVKQAGSTKFNAVAAAIMAKGPLSLQNSTIQLSKSWGLRHTASDTTDYVTSNTYSGNASGDVTTLP